VPAISQTQGPFNAAASGLKFCGTTSTTPQRRSLPIDANAHANAAGLPALAEHRSTLGPGFRLSPRATGTDGFYIATLTRTCEANGGGIRNVRTGTPRLKNSVQASRLVIPAHGPNPQIAPLPAAC
jgi:hypothetical protein